MPDVEQPVLLASPAVARSPTPADRLAHVQDRGPQPRAKKDRPEPEGKRWARRRENARFTHNPHIALPTTLDFAHPLQLPASTFPHPLPSYLPRTIPLPPSRPPPSLPHTASAGLFSLSLRGARRTLRARPSSPYLVKAIETHLVAWLQGGTYLNPDQTRDLLHFPGDPVGGREDIREVAREAGRLVWAVKAAPSLADPGSHDGGFERYVVHCVARWYGVVSFSKESDGYRLTYLLRPNVTRPDPRINPASRLLDTPPSTDVSDVHISDASFSDFNTTDTSDHDATDSSDIDSVPGHLPLSDIEEDRPSSPASWSDVGESNSGIDSNDDRGFVASMESLSLSAHAESDDSAAPSAYTTCTLSRPHDPGSPPDTVSREQDDNSTPSRARTHRDRLRTLYPRSTSSPSPARRSSHRLPTPRKSAARRKRKLDKGFAGAVGTDKGSFYDYLFA